MPSPFKLFGLLALLAAPAHAHEKGGRAMGTVESVTPDRIVIRASDGHAVSFSVTPDTRFFIGDKAARLEDARPGVRAVVRGRGSGDALTASRVKLAPPAR